jgi:hypothetical protein
VACKLHVTRSRRKSNNVLKNSAHYEVRKGKEKVYIKFAKTGGEGAGAGGSNWDIAARRLSGAARASFTSLYPWPAMFVSQTHLSSSSNFLPYIIRTTY